MIRRFITAVLFVALFSVAHAAPPPELAELQTTDALLLAGRVTGPYETGMESLNAKFVAALTTAGEEAMKDGKLPEVLAIEEDKKRIAGKLPLPEKDDAKTPVSLKKLRAVYREQSKKLLEQRTAAHAALLPAYTANLQALESTLTKAARLEEAKEVMQYREGLGTALSQAPIGNEFTNSLGMKFVKVPGTDVLFCIHETRRQDYAAYAKEIPSVDGSWKNGQRFGFPSGHEDNHPVVSVNWDDAQAFCAWLSKKEGRIYRLPTDREWSYAVGIGNNEKWTDKTTPEMLNGKVENEFPWGDDYPPKTKNKAGNYGDMSLKEKSPNEPCIEGYTDGFVTTAPVMSFKPGKHGIYDLGGNVWEWVQDWYNAEQKLRTLRGSSFHPNTRDLMLSSFRYNLPPAWRDALFGFRIVLEEKKP